MLDINYLMLGFYPLTLRLAWRCVPLQDTLLRLRCQSPARISTNRWVNWRNSKVKLAINGLASPSVKWRNGESSGCLNQSLISKHLRTVCELEKFSLRLWSVNWGFFLTRWLGTWSESVEKKQVTPIWQSSINVIFYKSQVKMVHFHLSVMFLSY